MQASMSRTDMQTADTRSYRIRSLCQTRISIGRSFCAVHTASAISCSSKARLIYETPLALSTTSANNLGRIATDLTRSACSERSLPRCACTCRFTKASYIPSTITCERETSVNTIHDVSAVKHIARLTAAHQKNSIFGPSLATFARR